MVSLGYSRGCSRWRYYNSSAPSAYPIVGPRRRCSGIVPTNETVYHYSHIWGFRYYLRGHLSGSSGSHSNCRNLVRHYSFKRVYYFSYYGCRHGRFRSESGHSACTLYAYLRPQANKSRRLYSLSWRFRCGC